MIIDDRHDYLTNLERGMIRNEGIVPVFGVRVQRKATQVRLRFMVRYWRVFSTRRDDDALYPQQAWMRIKDIE